METEGVKNGENRGVLIMLDSGRMACVCHLCRHFELEVPLSEVVEYLRISNTT
jgi:hypothetical protein